MNFLTSIIVILLFLKIVYSKLNLKDFIQDSSSKSIAKAITEIIYEFYLSNNINFDFIIFNSSSTHINDITNQVKMELNENFPMTIKQTNNLYRLEQSAVIFIKSEGNFQNFLAQTNSLKSMIVNLVNSQPKKLKFFVYIEDIKSFQLLENSVKFNNDINLLYPGDLRYFAFFLIENENSVELIANLLYSENICEVFHLKHLNSFDLKLLEWNENLEDFNHFSNFHGCMLKLLVDLGYFFFFENWNDFYFKLNTEKTIIKLKPDDCKFQGLLYEILEYSAKKYNFLPQYTLQVLDNLTRFYFVTGNFLLKFEHNIYLKTYVKEAKDIHMYHFSKNVAIHKLYYLIARNDAHTNYEKMLFAFDSVTWILILIFFGFTFGIIFILYKCPRWIRIIVFGRGVNNAAYNALGIFFGISMLRVPRESFCRAILITFIWYCLIIRTCWQSKMFEYLTTDMRKPLPEKFEDLKRMNYTIVTIDEYSAFLNESINNRESPNVLITNLYHFYNLYNQSLNDVANSKFAFFIDEQEHLSYNRTFKKSLPKLPDGELYKELLIRLPKNNFIMQYLNELLEKFFSSGISKYLNEYGFWHMNKFFVPESDDPRKVFTMSDLEFGFVIFLTALFSSFIVFICEILYFNIKFKVSRQLMELFLLMEFLKALRQRLIFYNDRW
ncbi:hypothetical protein PVAND_009062 [Polypedilum vanderplanki]|uniref:Ionotropic receptor n=1 Tax=Polypedilum vanderplanki TaxID=319348 RepID=A0A9J6CBR2_POLVA|nr:hypothetical protein PVAND_009062 [Polypedilum vanderplanki]